ncbi:hypothetical protein [Brachyspira sp.]|uniref:hypothetical protein n=1 Tax=Brachyspira sp. TaxID=1977261 RepID=UPI003D7DB728
MSNIKKIFTYLVVGALVMALSISCKSNEEPEKELVEIPSQYYGGWVYNDYSSRQALELRSGVLKIFNTNRNNLVLEQHAGMTTSDTYNWSYAEVIKNSDTSWTFKGTYTFSFDTSTAGTLAYDGATYNITKTNN